MADLRQDRTYELDSLPPVRHSQRRLRTVPTPQTVHDGDLVWFPYTASQWMRGRVVNFGRAGLRVEVMGGALPRTVYVKWGDVHWHQRRAIY
jgi:hypothetical protein